MERRDFVKLLASTPLVACEDALDWKKRAIPKHKIATSPVHLKHTNHSRAFWNELDKKMPNYHEPADWLKRNGVKLDLS